MIASFIRALRGAFNRQQRPALRLPGFPEEALRTILFVLMVVALFDMTIPRSLVDGRSMQPTFVDGDRLVISRLHYLATAPRRGDLVVFNSVNPRDRPGTMLIKRIIGLPGETIGFQQTRVTINGVVLEEPYLAEPCEAARCDDSQTWQLAAGQYFVMGDNRNHSEDSRRFGPVGFDHLVGTVVLRYFPLPRAGLITGYPYASGTP
ncbi:MAG: signal peptidase I [Anaerolineae bacterium]|jgi:signal peptidase I|nr:signal peptidase I [Anaerolineae bacterium]